MISRVKSASILLLFLCSILTAQDQNPRNIILLIGDGMGINAVSTSILIDPQSPFNEFNSLGLSITTALDNLITDSAAGATAISTGHKTNNGYISLSPSGEKLKTIFFEAKEKGMSTGLVVTSSVTHATPAAFYSHNISRDNEVEIAAQLLDSKTDVAIGAGTKFFPSLKKDIEKFKAAGYNYYSDAPSLLSSSGNDRIIALLEPSSLSRAVKRNYTLAQLVEKALETLSTNDKGFILMVEGSQIDWAAHENDPDYLLSEMKDFSGAITSALKFASKDNNTLVIVTADHETGGTTITDGNLKKNTLRLGFNSIYHTAGVVPVFAKGPGEANFRGTYQNNILGQKLFNLLKTSGNN